MENASFWGYGWPHGCSEARWGQDIDEDFADFVDNSENLFSVPPLLLLFFKQVVQGCIEAAGLISEKRRVLGPWLFWRFVLSNDFVD